MNDTDWTYTNSSRWLSGWHLSTYLTEAGWVVLATPLNSRAIQGRVGTFPTLEAAQTAADEFARTNCALGRCDGSGLIITTDIYADKVELCDCKPVEEMPPGLHERILAGVMETVRGDVG